jgi:FkbM family methyltransferase
MTMKIFAGVQKLLAKSTNKDTAIPAPHVTTSQSSSPQPKSLEDQVYLALLNNGDHCFDIGAHKGELSLYLAELVGSSGSVIAFEPVWPLYAAMCQELQATRGTRAPVTPCCWGLSNQSQSAAIHVPISDYGAEFGVGSMANPEEWSHAQDHWRVNQSAVKMQRYQAEFITLDQFLQVSCATVPDFIKIDVEGAELLVLQGAKDFFAAGHRPLMLMELFAPWEKAFHYQPWTPLSLLMSYGYEILFICPEGVVAYHPRMEQPFPAEYVAGYNIIAYQPQQHQSRIDRLKSIRANNPNKQVKFMAPGPCPNHIVEL